MTNPPGGHNPPLPYEEATSEAYAAFADDCDAVPTARGVRLIGRCRRCGDDMSYDTVDRFYRGGLPWRRSRGTDSAKTTLRMLCTCKVEHPGRPEDEEGCGAYWTVEITRS
jgi:hypothetical protein